MGAIVGQHDVDFARHGLGKMSEKITRGFAQSFAMKLDEDEFACAINGNKEIEPFVGKTVPRTVF